MTYRYECVLNVCGSVYSPMNRESMSTRPVVMLLWCTGRKKSTVGFSVTDFVGHGDVAWACATRTADNACSHRYASPWFPGRATREGRSRGLVMVGL